MHNVSEWKSCTIFKMQFIDLLLVRSLIGDDLDIKNMRILNTLSLGMYVHRNALKQIEMFGGETASKEELLNSVIP